MDSRRLVMDTRIESVPVDVETPPQRLKPRRALLVGAIGGLAAWAAAAVGRTPPAIALDPNDVVLGGVNTASTTTRVRNPFTHEPALAGAAATGTGVLGTSRDGSGVHGTSEGFYGVSGFSDGIAGVHGASNEANGVEGHSSNGVGVNASSQNHAAIGAFTSEGKAAVYAVNGNQNHPYPAVFGASHGSGPGVLGVWSGDASPPRLGLSGRSHTGVYGVAGGPEGLTLPGATGVHGLGDGRGVYGVSPTGQGVRGASTSGTGGAFISATGYALSTSGRVRFTKASGVATIAAGTSTKRVTPGVGLTSGSFVLLTPRGNLSTRALWYTVDPTTDTFTIRVSSAVATNVGIGWLVLG